MRQALHIFRKDVRHLWREIALLLALAGVFAWIRSEWLETIVYLAATYLIARVVHAEAIPGNRQFWITRPYRWTSLLGSKLLFTLAFVNLPLLLVQLWIAAGSGFPFLSYLPGLLCSQLFIVLGVSLPLMAVAALTPGIVSFIFSALALTGVWRGVATISSLGYRRVETWPGAIEWIRFTALVLVLASVVIAILYVQYRQRRTLLCRIVGGIALLALMASLWLVPWTPAWAIQTTFGRQPVAPSMLQVSADPNSVQFVVLNYRSWRNVDVKVRIKVGSIPEGTQVRADAVQLRLEGADGTVATSLIDSARSATDKSGGLTLEPTSVIDSQFYRHHLGKPVTIRGSVYMTLFGNPREKTIPLSRQPVNALDGLQCFLGPVDELYCRSAFRWPGKLVFAKFGADMSPLTGLISYAPFAMSFGLDPIQTHWEPLTPHAAREVTIVVKEPLAHIRRDFELRDVLVKEWDRRR